MARSIKDYTDEQVAYLLLADDWLQQGIIADSWDNQAEGIKEHWLKVARAVRRAFELFIN